MSRGAVSRGKAHSGKAKIQVHDHCYTDFGTVLGTPYLISLSRS